MKRISTKLKILKGTYKKCREKNDKINLKTMEKAPKAPAYLTKSGKKIWKEATELLIKYKMMHQVDLPSLEGYIFNVELCQILPDEIMKEGVLTVHVNRAGESNKIKNPKLAVYNEALRMINLFGSKFGFDPLSRTKIDMPETEEDPLEKYRNNSFAGL